MSEPERRAAMSELIWDIALAYDWQLAVKDQVRLAGWMAAQPRLTVKGIREAAERLGLTPPPGALATLQHNAMDYDRRRLVR